MEVHAKVSTMYMSVHVCTGTLCFSPLDATLILYGTKVLDYERSLNI